MNRTYPDFSGLGLPEARIREVRATVIGRNVVPFSEDIWATYTVYTKLAISGNAVGGNLARRPIDQSGRTGKHQYPLAAGLQPPARWHPRQHVSARKLVARGSPRREPQCQ